MTSKLIYESTIPLLGIFFNGNFFTRETGHVNTHPKLLEKVEELTLYILEQQRQINQLKIGTKNP